MRNNRIKYLVKVLVVTFVLSLAPGSTQPSVWAEEGLDVYIIYSGKTRGAIHLLAKSIPKYLSVKSYNANLLVLADYSGKQKAISKFHRARLIVILGDQTLEILESGKLKRALVIVGSTKTNMKSDVKTLYVVSKGTNLDDLRAKKIITAKDRLDLATLDKVRAVDVVLVDQDRLKIMEAVSLIIERMIEQLD